MRKQNLVVHATLGAKKIFIPCADREIAEQAAKDCKREGYTDVRIVEND